MPSDEFPICGTARLAIVALTAKANFRRALRALARELPVDARELMAAALEGWQVQEIPVAVAEHVHAAALLATGDAVQGERLRQARAGAVQHWAAELDEIISTSRRTTADDRMWLARSLSKRGLAAHVLGDAPVGVRHYREAITLLGETWSPDHPEVGAYLDDCATLLLSMGRPDEAEAMMAQARAIEAKVGIPADLG